VNFGKSEARLLAVLPILLSGCEPRITTIAEFDAGLGRYIEAESGQLSGPFSIGDDATASAGHFIYANEGKTFDSAPGSARAAYDLIAETAGTYQIWGRIHGQDIDSNRFWFQVDGSAWILWRITTGDVWFWSYFHDNFDYGTRYTVDLTVGPHRLVIANATDNAGLDRLYYAPDAGKPENSETLCNPPHTVQFNGVCNPSCGKLGGLCVDLECDASAPVPTYDCTRGCCASAQ
jgi:hypothetical protein